MLFGKKRCNDYGYSLLDKDMFFFKKSLFTHFEKVVQDFKGRGTIKVLRKVKPDICFENLS